jgi:hypothetical protein
MAIRRCFIGLATASIFVIGIWLLGFVPQATAETLNFKSLDQATKQEFVLIPDVEGHVIGVMTREGVAVFENGELGWLKATLLLDLVKGAGAAETYATYTLTDGSTFTTHNKGTLGAGPQAVSKFTGDIIHGTGRFQGIKGTVTSSTKSLPPVKGEPGPKSFREGILVYTLPSK